MGRKPNHNRAPEKALETRKSLFGLDFYECLYSARARARSAHRTTSIYLEDGDYLHVAYRDGDDLKGTFIAKVDDKGWVLMNDGRLLQPFEAELPADEVAALVDSDQ